MDLRMGLYLMSLLNMVFGSPEASYSINLNKLSFEDAQNYCKPGSFLTNLKNKEEITKIQKAIWDKTNKATTLFWIGLKKKKGQCVYQNKPLKGFHWTVDNTEYLQDIRWKEEPLGTCTDERCGLLSVEYSDSETKISGLANAACKQKYAFICKRNMDVTCPSPFILGTHDIIETPNDPFTRHVICSSGAEFTLVCSNDLTWNVVGNENSDTDVSQLCLQCKSGYRRDASGNCVDINECKPFSPCKHSCLNTDGSYKCVCSDNEQHADDCGESTTPTTHLKNYNVDPTYSNVNILESDLVQPHDGSVNETSDHSEEHSEDIANIVVPVIIALLILVVLLVIIAAIVKGCMRRQSVKRAQRKAEAVALSGSSSTEKVNENEVHKRDGPCTLS